MVDETQISKPQEYADIFKQNLTCIFISVRGTLKETFQCETPCISDIMLGCQALVDLQKYKAVLIFGRIALKYQKWKKYEKVIISYTLPMPLLWNYNGFD